MCLLLRAEVAYWIFEVCGHKCVCKRCMRKAKKPDKEDRRSQGKPGRKPGKKPGKQGKKPAWLRCPLCRRSSKVVQPDDYDGLKPVMQIWPEESVEDELWWDKIELGKQELRASGGSSFPPADGLAADVS